MSFIATPFPVNVLPESLQRFVSEVAEAVVCPIDFPAAMALAAISGAIGNTRTVVVKESWEEPTQLYMGIIAAPSSKKSPVLKKIVAPFEEKQKDYLRKYDHSLEDFQQKYAIWEATEPQKRGSKPKEPTPKRLLIGDATFEAISRLLEENPRGLLLSLDELTSWLKSMDQYRKGKGGDKEKWLSLWNCTLPPLDRSGRKRPTMPDNPFITTFGTTQPDKLKYFLQKDHDGFIDRILFSFPEEVLREWSERTVSRATQHDYRSLIYALLDLEPDKDGKGRAQPKKLTFTQEAKNIFRKFVDDNDERINQEGNPLLKSAFGKLEAYYFRMTLILQLAHDPKSTFIDAEAAAGATALIGYFRDHLYKVHDYIKGKAINSKYLRIKEGIHSNGGHITIRDLYTRKIGGVKNAAQAKSVLREMEQKNYGRLRKEKNSSGGKPTYSFHLKTCRCERCNQQSPLIIVNQ